MPEFKDKVALVTGGSRDIGKAVSVQLAMAGASVVVNYYKNKEQADQTVDEITKAGGNALAIKADVTKSDDVARLVQSTLNALGSTIHILVNVAGGLVARKKIDEMDEEFWDQVIRLNLTSTFLVSKSVLPHMAEGGAIVNFSSQAGRDGGGAGAIAYSSAKGGIMSFTRGLAKELGPRRIRVNCVTPGMINTTFHNTFTKSEVRQRVASMTPVGREGEAFEVANLVLFLASDAASFINGASIDINGGILFS
ncbi:MAG TPA: oxidoreductase [Bacteroidetes bacterium]|nr:oxidoreductase [Bacteroidota bacterium]